MKSPLQTRRAFLRSSSALIALPALESLGFRRFASAAAVIARPKRMLFFGFGYGVTKETWYPKREDLHLAGGIAAAEGEDYWINPWIFFWQTFRDQDKGIESGKPRLGENSATTTLK